MFYKISTLFLCVLCIICVQAYEDCGSKSGSIVSVKVSNCEENTKCILKRSTNVTIGITFTTNSDSDTLKAVVYGVVIGVPIPFNVPNPNGCKDCGVTCPIRAGQTYNYETTLPVLKSYPRVTVEVKWELQDKDGTNIVCVLIPAQIK